MADGYNSGYYAQQSSDAQYRANTDLANNAYGRLLSQQRGSRNLGGLQRNFNRQLPGYKSSFSQRGMAGPGIQTGVMQRGMSNYMGDYARDYGQAVEDNNNELMGFDRNAAQIQSGLQQNLSGIEQNKQNDIANAALMLEQLRPYLGGL
jgi:hypothetical protein